jgi:hypothetical protein
MEQMLKDGGNRAVRVYQSTNGHGVEFILTTHGRQELNVFRYLDRTGWAGWRPGSEVCVRPPPPPSMEG